MLGVVVNCSYGIEILGYLPYVRPVAVEPIS